MVEGSCHCGAIRFEAPEPERLLRCDCSYCDRVGADWAYCPPDAFRLLSDPSAVATYQFAHKVVEHHHCPTCGCATHQHSPEFVGGKPDFDNPKVGYNVRMMRGVDRSALPVDHLEGARF